MILAFKTGKGSTDGLFDKFGKEGEEKIKVCEFDTKRYFDDNPFLTSKLIKNPTHPNAKLYWHDLYDKSLDVDSYMFWGFMRGTKTIYEKALETKKDFYFFDHAYVYHKKHSIFLERLAANPFFRMVKNEFVLTTIKDTDDTKLLQMRKDYSKIKDLDILPWNKKGSYILIIPPSVWLCNYIGIDAEQMMKDSIETIKKHTDREIKIRYKKPDGDYNLTPLEKDIDSAWAVVSFQSSAAIKAVNRGVPSFLMKPGYSATQPVSLTDLSKIETPFYPDNRYEWLSSICNNQFLKHEITTGKAYRYLNEHN